MDNIIIATDNEGHNLIVNQRYLKYNRLISNVSAAYLLRKNTVIIDNKDVANTIIESDTRGNNTVKSFDEYVKEEMDEFSDNIFKDFLKKTREKKEIQSNKNEIEVYLTEKRENLQEKLKKATECNRSHNYFKAIELYENALQDITSDSYPDEFMLKDYDILAIKFALVLSNLEVRDYKRLQTAQDILNSLIRKYGCNFPSMYYYLATVYYDFGYYVKAINSLEEGLKTLDNLKSEKFLEVINWPGTNEIMDETLTKTELNEKMETLMNECKVEHPPDRKCLFSLCESNNKIYFMNLNFNGYVTVNCSNKCYFSYHTTCWKKKLKHDGVKAKTILNQVCPTDDCGGFIETIEFFDESLCLISCSSSEKAQSKNGFNYNPIYKDHKFRNKNDEIDTSTTIEILEDENKIKQDLSSAHSQIKSDTELYKQNSIETPQNSTPEATLTIKSQLNTNAKEYVPPIREPMFEVVRLCDQATQTSENYISQSEYNVLKCDITILQAELFKSEENYNDLLCQHETLKLENVLNLKSTVDIGIQTESIRCENCSIVEKDYNEKALILKKLEEEIQKLKKDNNEKDLIIQKLKRDENEKDLFIKNFKRDLTGKDLIIKNLLEKCGNFELQLKQRDYNLQQRDHELKQKHHELSECKTARLLDTEVYVQAEQKFLGSNKVLMLKLKEVQEAKDNLELEVNRSRTDVNKVAIQQILHIKSFYINYINMFQNKCKHMIWELEDIKTLTNVNTLPSSTEIEDNLIMWRQALDTALKSYAIMMEFYDKIIHNLNLEPGVATPMPNLIPEPPSVILRHFKSYFLHIKRLEQDLHRHIANYYQVLSMPNPGTVPQNLMPICGRRESRCEDMNSSNPPPASGDLEEIVVNEEETTKEEMETTDLNLESSGLEEAVGGELNGCEKESPKQKEIDVIKEKLPENPTPVTPVSPKLVVGPEGLLYKLQQKCPLTPPYILQEAIKILREARGGLSGLDSKTLLTELKIIITDLSKKERQKPGYQKITNVEKPSPWAPINKDLGWYNANPRGNCVICFERMTKSDSTQLKCQHVFHTTCLKQWLPNNGICPICRSFTTLDDEFPALK